jgi:hypothetical protein
MLNRFARAFMERIEFFMDSSSEESVYNVYVDMVKGQM